MKGKIIAIFPVASSQSPSSGDGFLLSRHAMEDQHQYLRAILRGNDDFFPVLIADGGFVCSVPNAPNITRDPNFLTLATICQQENAVLLHTSSKYEKYHLERNNNGKIVKTAWVPNKPTL